MLRKMCRIGRDRAFLPNSDVLSQHTPRCLPVVTMAIPRQDACSVRRKVTCLTLRPFGHLSTVQALGSSQTTGHLVFPFQLSHCLQRHLKTNEASFPLPGFCIRTVSTSCGGALQKKKAVAERKTSSDGQEVTIGKKVAQTSKTASYAGIILLGFGLIGLMFYTVGQELFSSNSPNGIYTKAFKLCKNNLEIQDSLGTPIKGYGEMTRRKRRRHVSHLEYSQGGVNFMRMKFYLEGPERKATVHLEMKENESGRYEYRYLFVELDGYPQRTIILEDNR